MHNSLEYWGGRSCWDYEGYGLPEKQRETCTEEDPSKILKIKLFLKRDPNNKEKPGHRLWVPLRPRNSEDAEKKKE